MPKEEDCGSGWYLLGGVVIGGIAAYVIIKYAVIETAQALVTKTIGGVQAATVKVNVSDKTIGQPISKSNVIVMLDGKKIGEGVTDNLGNAMITIPSIIDGKSVLPGKVNITVNDPVSGRTLSQDVTIEKKSDNEAIFQFQKQPEVPPPTVNTNGKGVIVVV